MSEQTPIGFSEVAGKALYSTLESLLEIKSKKGSLRIGIPKETSFQENRVPLTPLSVGLLVANGHEVIVETSAGKASNFLDKEYSEAGAIIGYDTREVFASEIVIKVAPPSTEEIGYMKAGQTLISALHTATLTKDYVKLLIDKKITAIAYEFLRDESGILSVMRSMSEIVGSSSIFIAAEYLSNVSNGKGLLFGGITGIPPTEIVIIGAGTVGESAARTALGLGAMVKVFDNSVHRLRRLQNNINSPIFTSVIQPVVLAKALSRCDVAIGALRAETGRSPVVVSEGMVEKMKPFSVIVDVTIDQGGCFETSEITNHTKPTFIKHGVTHYCVPNIASRVSRTATYGLTNIFTPILLQMGEAGGIKNLVWENMGIRSGIYIFNGHLTNAHMAKRFDMPHKNLDLLIAAHG